MTDGEQWTRRLNRERNARKKAETLLEDKSRELWNLNQSLAVINDDLENRILERTRQLEHARDSAEDASRAKSMFLATMSHEIRTPLNGVLGMNRLLLDTDLNGEQRDFAETMLGSARNLLSLLNDILDLSKFQAGKLDFEQVEFDLRVLVEECCDLVVEKTQARRIELVGIVSPGLEVRRIGDPGRLRQILLNLLTNAAKFTEEGEILVKVEGREGRPDLLRVSVNDTGIGINTEAIRRLFQTFSQVDASTTRKYGGTGRGLAICKLLVEQMGGEVGVDSVEGQGSCFWFEVALPQWAELPEPKSMADYSKVRALVISPSATLGDWLAREVVELGAAAEYLSVDELQALPDSESQRWDVAILDRADYMGARREELNELAAMHANSTIDLRLSTRRKGDSSSDGRLELLKPVRRRALQIAVAKAAQLEVFEGGASNRREHAPLRKAQLVDGRRLHVLLAEDNSINMKLAMKVLEKLEVKATPVGNGFEAVEAAGAGEFDLVLMDCQMPEMDGYEATSAIRQAEYEGGQRIPIIALTANAMPGDRQRCIDSGMDDYLTKPFLPEELLRVLDQWGGSSQSRREAS
jgi:two-component system sensor histidine kinase/response regulator